MALPQVISWVLFDSQTLIGPCAVSAEPPEALVPPELLHARRGGHRQGDHSCCVDLLLHHDSVRWRSARMRDRPCWVHWCLAGTAARLMLE